MGYRCGYCCIDIYSYEYEREAYFVCFVDLYCSDIYSREIKKIGNGK